MSVIYTDVYHVQIQDAERFHPHKVFASLDPIVLYSFSPFSVPVNHSSDFCPYSFAFSRLSCERNRTCWSFLCLAILTTTLQLNTKKTISSLLCGI